MESLVADFNQFLALLLIFFYHKERLGNRISQY